ncbi:hypothetical protein D1007_45026 [Hordeum vulgare]|nr:hypothetical protein D1007_45026 [Hordeum vulgare]
MEFGVHLVDTQRRKMDLTVLYTNDPVRVEDSINTIEQLLAKDDKYKVVGFDQAYTCGRVVHNQKVAIPSCSRAITSSSTTTAWPQFLASISPAF